MQPRSSQTWPRNRRLWLAICKAQKSGERHLRHGFVQFARRWVGKTFSTCRIAGGEVSARVVCQSGCAVVPCHRTLSQASNDVVLER